jgi:calcineurin-like phosphoesterase family protein
VTTMRTWVISDTHFGHANIIKYCERPFSSVDEMNREMTRRWNSVVAPEDLVYHLGDFCFGGKGSVTRYRWFLNGHIVLVRGNHDTRIKLSDPNFDFVCDRLLVPHGGRIFDLRHRPPEPEDLTRYPDHIYLYGHVHRNTVDYSLDFPGIRAYNLGTENWDYTPQPLENFLKT